ncbi:S8 family serine peptidase [uncultured Dokdonia sp.]|uniref:S8 family serine peptidase n=1 Tax=uncultured Dokdonia sp. TaxID=575653 RepID=UPI00260AADF2|nr:S8 family serine peptidase [uncultured Dokdonia sp.]
MRNFKIAVVFIATFGLLSSCSTEENIDLTDESNLTVEDSRSLDEVTVIPAADAISGEYIIVFKEDSNERSFNNYQASERGRTQELSRIKEFYTQKSTRVLSENSIDTKNLSTVYTGVFQGFYAKNLTESDIENLKSDNRIAFIEPNLALTADFPIPATPEGVSEKDILDLAAAPNSRDVQLPNGEFLPWGVQYVGRTNNANTNRYGWVIDSGIAPHPDLAIVTGLSRSFVNGEPSWQDANGHGTHVAGTLGARNNGSGVIGVAYGTSLVAVKVLGASGSGSTDGILSGVDYVYNSAIAGDVFNYSVGFRNRFTSNAIDNAFRRLDDRIYGALAAGNSNDNTQFYSPQRINTSRTWMVGSIDRSNKQPSSFSNFGSSVDRWAPGRDVWSTWLNGGFNRISGTSMASPHVAGILAGRGNNSVGTQGNVSKGGFSASRAKL